MFFSNKWANVAMIALIALVVSAVVVKSSKVIAKDGTVGDSTLKPFASTKNPAAK